MPETAFLSSRLSGRLSSSRVAEPAGGLPFAQELLLVDEDSSNRLFSNLDVPLGLHDARPFQQVSGTLALLSIPLEG